MDKILLNGNRSDLYYGKYEARLVVGGYNQVQGVDFNDTMSPTPNQLIIERII